MMRKLVAVIFLFLSVNAHSETWYSNDGDTFDGTNVQLFEWGGKVDLASGQSSPTGSTNVWRWTIPAGFPMGEGVGNVWLQSPPAGTTEVWVQYYYKYSPGFYFYNINKQMYMQPGNSMTMGLISDLGVNLQPQTKGQSNHFPNVEKTYSWYVNTGEWHKYKARYVLNTGTSWNGIFQAWVDDVMTNNYSDIKYEDNPTTFYEPVLLMIPSGGGPANPTMGYWYVAGIYIGSTDPGGGSENNINKKYPNPPVQLKINK
jgi:hypothetical protein